MDFSRSSAKDLLIVDGKIGMTTFRAAPGSTFKSSSNSEIYLLLDINIHIMTRFRFGISDIAVHNNRYRDVPNDALNCPLCKNAKEDETHLLLCCPAFSDLRQQLIPSKYYENPCLFRMTSTCGKIKREYPEGPLYLCVKSL